MRDWGRTVSFLGVHQSDFLCSVMNNGQIGRLNRKGKQPNDWWDLCFLFYLLFIIWPCCHSCFPVNCFNKDLSILFAFNVPILVNIFVNFMRSFHSEKNIGKKSTIYAHWSIELWNWYVCHRLPTSLVLTDISPDIEDKDLSFYLNVFIARYVLCRWKQVTCSNDNSLDVAAWLHLPLHNLHAK